MTEPRVLRFYLDDGLRQSARAGQHNFIAHVSKVAEDVGYRIEYRVNSQAERVKSATRRGYALFHMDGPVRRRVMTFRRVYYYPFRAIEQSPKRWEWQVARAEFDPRQVRRKKADRFFEFWQNRLFGTQSATATKDGFVYVPLQGRLLQHRSFQSCTPIEMVEHVLNHDPNRRVVAALHPNETYDDAEIAALERLVDRFGRLDLAKGDMERWLSACDYVVTQNSSAGFAGYFFRKPLLLFGEIDFAHIAVRAGDDLQEAFHSVRRSDPDYAAYIHWFWQEMSINAGHPDAEKQIRDRFRAAGWPMD